MELMKVMLTMQFHFCKCCVFTMYKLWNSEFLQCWTPTLQHNFKL